MARISTYSLDEEVSGGDKWIGSDSGFYNKTKNFTPLKLADYLNSSEKIDSSNSLRFWYQTLDPFEERGVGTISFESEVGISVPFSGISSFLLSKNTEGTIYIYDFFNSLLESKILLHKADTINTYAIYEVVGIEEYDLNSDFLKVNVSFVRGNGGLLEDKSYLISVIDFALEAQAISNHSELNLDDGTNPHGTTKADVGLDNVDNTSDLDKPISNDTQSALDLKVPYTGATQDVDLGDYELKAGQVEFDTTPIGNTGVGVMRWNDADGTLDLGLKGGNVTLQVGQESVIRVVNKTSTNITLSESNYQAVRVTGAQGQRLKVDLALATNDLLSAETIGLVTETIENNQEGFITTSGLIRGIDTTGDLQGEDWSDGDILYLSPSVYGRITNIKPVAPNHLVIIGYVVYAHQNNGSIFVKVDNGYELEELHNVTETNYTTPIDADSLLTFDVNNSLWKRLSWANIKSNLKTYFDTIYQTALGFIPENVANKANDLTSPDNTKYPTTQAVVDGLATKQNTLTNPITGTGSNGQVAFFNGTTTQTGDNGLFWDNTNKSLKIFNPSVGDGKAPLIVRNTTPYQSPFTQFIQFWQVGAGSNVMSLRADGSLDTIGNIRSNTLRLSGVGTNTTSFNMLARNGQDGTGINFLSGHTIGITTNSVERMRILSTGEVTIGSATAGARLDVRAQGALSTDIAFRVRNSADNNNLFSVNGLGATTITQRGNTTLHLRNTELQDSGGSDGTIIAQVMGGFYENSVSYGGMRLLTDTSWLSSQLGFFTGGYSGNPVQRMVIKNNGNVGINTSTPVASAQLQVDSTTRGFLPPRMTTTQRNAIATPAAGLIVYDTTENKHYGYNGTSWYNMDADIVTTNRQSASYTLTLTDRSKLVEMDVATANNLTIPLNSSVAFPIGTKIDVVQYGAGQTTFVPTSGVTIRSANNWLKMNARYGAATLTKIGTDEWYLWGNLNA